MSHCSNRNRLLWIFLQNDNNSGSGSSFTTVEMLYCLPGVKRERGKGILLASLMNAFLELNKRNRQSLWSTKTKTVHLKEYLECKENSNGFSFVCFRKLYFFTISEMERRKEDNYFLICRVSSIAFYKTYFFHF